MTLKVCMDWFNEGKTLHYENIYLLEHTNSPQLLERVRLHELQQLKFFKMAVLEGSHPELPRPAEQVREIKETYEAQPRSSCRISSPPAWLGWCCPSARQ